ncbi:MAG TPA: hypothetical protein VFR86_15545, partial [Burkholderiaceae bacterium]|nr:hypothetical protein [Burkholderiaceae bacterium]
MAQPSKTRENVDTRAARPDPYFAWAKATGFRYLPAGATAVPLLIELADGVSVQAFAKGGWLASKRLESAVRVPPIYAKPPRGIEQARYCTALVAIKELDRVVDDAGWKKLVARYGFGLPVYARFAAAATGAPESAAGTAKQRTLPAGAALAAATTSAPRTAGQRSQGAGGSSGGAGNTEGVRGPVVIGVIDDGIAFAHEVFLARPGTTRIKSLWNQEAAVPVPPATVPAAFLYGQELPDTVINNALAQFTHAGLVDEDAVYRHTGHEQYTSGIHKAVGRRAAHGTHVLDLAATLGPATPPAERPIVAVQLPSAVTGDTSGAHLNPQAIEAILYILQQAEKLGAQHGKPLPVVINLSYGMHAGPHDGTHVIEAAIDQIIDLWSTTHAPVAIVLPAGNSRLARCHAQLTLAADEAKTLHWRVQPDDRTPSSMEIWLPAPPAGEATAKVEVEVKDPTGAALPVTIKEGEAFPSPLTTPVPCFVDYAAPAFPGARTKIVIVLAPTAPTDPPDPAEKLAPAGVWEVKVKNTST